MQRISLVGKMSSTYPVRYLLSRIEARSNICKKQGSDHSRSLLVMLS